MTVEKLYNRGSGNDILVSQRNNQEQTTNIAIEVIFKTVFFSGCGLRAGPRDWKNGEVHSYREMAQ